jgi:uncharacterized metal-binding protein
VLYLACWIVFFGLLGLAIVRLYQDVAWSWQQFGQDITRSLHNYQAEWIALFVGLELGAMSHSLSDWTNSGYKRFKRTGVTGLLSQPKKRKPPKRRATSRKRSSSRRTSKN